MIKYLSIIALCSILGLYSAFGQVEEYEYGKNAFVQVGMDVNRLIQSRPTAGNGESQLGLSLFVDGGYIVQKYKSVWENDLQLAFSLQKSGAQPITKGNDKINLSSHYAFSQSYSSNWYTAADLSIRSQFARTYDNGLIQNLGDSLTLFSAFAAPIRAEISVGEEYRFPQSPFYFYGGAAFNIMHVANDEVAAFEATDRDGNIIGSLHGNPLDSKSLTQAGLIIKSRYRGDIIADRLMYDTNFRFFVNLLQREADFAQGTSPIDIEWSNTINFIIIAGISLTVKFDLLYDQDVVFLDDSQGAGSTDFTKEGISINSNILLSIRKTFGNDD